MIIQWLGHACFRLEADEYSIVLDPYGHGTVPGLRPLDVTASEALCSHGHGDHNAASLVRLEAGGSASPFTVTRLACFHDGEGGALRGPNTLHVLEAEDVRVAHLGDLGHPLTPEQAAAIGRLDAVMIPIGGYYTIGPEEAKAVVDLLRPHVVLPMHYRSEAFGFDEIGTLEPFLSLFSRVERLPGDTLEITRHMARRVAVPAYR